jgi:acylphosphatase
MKIRGIVKGKVHGIGYRSLLINMALEYGIDKFNTFNTKISGQEAVICLIDSSDEIVENMKNRIKEEKPDRAIVESIEFEDYKYEVPPIERCMQAFQMEHWGKAIPILLDIKDCQVSTLYSVKKVEKAIVEESEKTRDELGRKVEEVGNKVDKVGEKVDLLRMDMKEFIETNMKRIHAEISEIKQALRKAGIM